MREPYRYSLKGNGQTGRENADWPLPYQVIFCGTKASSHGAFAESVKTNRRKPYRYFTK